MTRDHASTPVEGSPQPRISFREQLPQPSLEYRSAVGKWLRRGESVGDHAWQEAANHPWWEGLWFTGGGALSRAILTASAAVFCKWFNESIGLAAAASLPYLALNLVVLGRGALEVIANPALLAGWRSALDAQGNFPLLIAGAVLVFPKLALGLSGFETGVSVMPLIDGGDTDRAHEPRTGGRPRGRVANPRKLLLTAAVIMSGMLILSSIVTTLLVDPVDYMEGGKASGRAIAFLAHRYLGPGFGTVYDAST